MTDGKDFELFKSHHGTLTRDAVLRCAYDWYTQCQLIANAMKVSEEINDSLLVVNDLFHSVIASHGLTDELTPEALQPYIEKRMQEIPEERRVAANGIRRHAELHLREVHANVGREAGKKSGEGRKTELRTRDDGIREEARKLLAQGKPESAIASILAVRYGLTAKRVREILKG
jgi:hypothetical protein